MKISQRDFEQVRERAGRVCEYCGVSEIDSGGLLTVDHFQPRASSGSDALDNLVYACFQCNNYKNAYWTGKTALADIWNPRTDPASTHFVELEDGRLLALTPVGSRTIEVLRLNRPPLVDYRRVKQRNRARDAVLARIIEVIRLRRQAERERSRAMKDQTDLLKELRDILAAQDMIETTEAPMLSADRALSIAQADAIQAYRDLSLYRIRLELEPDGWHVDYEPKDPKVKGGGPHDVIDRFTGAIVSRRYEQ